MEVKSLNIFEDLSHDALRENVCHEGSVVIWKLEEKLRAVGGGKQNSEGSAREEGEG